MSNFSDSYTLHGMNNNSKYRRDDIIPDNTYLVYSGDQIYIDIISDDKELNELLFHEERFDSSRECLRTVDDFRIFNYIKLDKDQYIKIIFSYILVDIKNTQRRILRIRIKTDFIRKP